MQGTFWSLVGILISRGMMFLASVSVARMLGVEVFGQWGVLRSTIDMFSILLGMGAGVTANRFIAEHKDKYPQKAERVLSMTIVFGVVMGMGMTLILFGASSYLAENILKKTALSMPLRVASLYLLVNAMGGVFTGVLAGCEAFRRITSANLISGLLGMPVIVLLTHWYGFIGTVWGYGCSFLLSSFLLGYTMAQTLKQLNLSFRLRGLSGELSTLYRFSLPATISGAIGGPILWLCYAYATHLPSGFRIIGTYSAAKVAQTVLQQIGMALHSPLLSLLSNSKGTPSNEKIVDALNILSSWSLGAIFCLFPVYIPELVSVLFGRSYADEHFATIISLTMYTTYIILYKQGFGRIIIFSDLMWWGVWENIWWSIVLVILVFFLAPRWGTLGFCSAFALAYGLDLIVISPFYLKKGIVSSEHVLSFEAWSISFLLLAGVAMVALEVHFLIRLGSAFLGGLAIPILFFRIYRRLQCPLGPSAAWIG